MSSKQKLEKIDLLLNQQAGLPAALSEILATVPRHVTGLREGKLFEKHTDVVISFVGERDVHNLNFGFSFFRFRGIFDEISRFAPECFRIRI